ncbi:nucleotidyltransferase domain-containing protein [Marivirga salinae]|uniref:Nucleotidyltransferase domain-containing protein n=1 Tax=Marivirga salinarum TaxID=3059078 RepID=A0AA51N8Y4_9BACT|nr:nucleotidyltransferase domain-containing protein [Marivirga sp. BDSF4-3]WMN11031.1 nucleotidyltransferase domain-containing protein [Marivirga sp. BDSF4-3]
MKKSNKYAKNGALIFGLGNSFIELIDQLKDLNKDPNIKFNWNKLLTAAIKGATVGTVVGFGIGSVRDYHNSQEKLINLNKHLRDLADSLALDKSSAEFINLNNSVNKIIKEFKNHFHKKIKGELIPHGSTEKGTALNDSYDIDIAIPFQSKSFPNNYKMYNEVYKYFDNRINTLNIVDIRKQKRSVGVCVEIKNKEYWIDFAPYKLSKNKSSGYLFVNKSGILFNNSTIQKTDLSILKKTKFTKVQKHLIVLLKNWKENEGLNLPSHFLEHLVKDAYRINKGNIPKSIDKKMIMILEHMANRLHIVRINGLENTNNKISESIDESDKQNVVDACKKIIRDYEYQPNSLIANFR